MRQLIIPASVIALLTSCGTQNNTTVNTNNSSNNNASADTAAAPPVETRAPNTAYQPAFRGQTRIGGVRTTTPYTVTTISTELSNPWGIAPLPDGRLIITQKGGSLRIATPAGALSPLIAGLPQVDARGQGGLLGIVVDPDFSSNSMLYWTFSEPVSGGNHTSVAKGRLAADDRTVENAVVIYRALPVYNGTLHYGSRILVARDGNLILCTGERSDLETRPQAQLLNSGLGKIIRITKDGQPAAGNPFLNRNDARPEIWSYGHRNPQGLAIHPATGDLWESEMGPRGGDEINLIKAGANYGWPTIGYGIEYSGQKVGAGITQQQGMEQPVYYWDPVLSPSGMTFYSGNAIPEWQNNLFICGLNSKHIARIVIRDNKVAGEERLLQDQNQRFRDITQGTDGALYAVTDGGRLYRIAKK